MTGFSISGGFIIIENSKGQEEHTELMQITLIRWLETTISESTLCMMFTYLSSKFGQEQSLIKLSMLPSIGSVRTLPSSLSSLMTLTKSQFMENGILLRDSSLSNTRKVQSTGSTTMKSETTLTQLGNGTVLKETHFGQSPQIRTWVQQLIIEWTNR